ncbi:MAG: hypothetical protein WA485_13995, partial [Candidatus Sulfotelmatobacter sp.]
MLNHIATVFVSTGWSNVAILSNTPRAWLVEPVVSLSPAEPRKNPFDCATASGRYVTPSPLVTSVPSIKSCELVLE